MKLNKKLVTTCIPVFLLILGLATPVFAQDKVNPDEFLESLEQQKNNNAKSMEFLIEGKNAWIQGDMNEAESFFQKAIKADNKNDAAYYELATVNLERDNTKAALRNVQAALKINPNEKWYRILESNIYGANGDFKKASQIFEYLVKRYPNEEDLYFEWVFMLEKGNMLKEAIKAMDVYENHFGIDEQVAMQKQRWYLQLGDVRGAVDEIEQLIKRDPHNVRYYVAIAKLYEANDMSVKAAKAYERLREIDPEHPELALAEARKFQDTGNEEELLQSMENVFKNESFDIDAKIKFLLPYINDFTNQENKLKILELCDLLVESHPREAKAFAMYGDFLFQDNQKREALIQYRKSVNIDENTFTVWQQILFIDSELNDSEALLNDSEEILSIFPNQPIPYYFNGIVKSQNKNYEKAIKMFDRSLKLAGENNLLKAQVYSSLGDTYRNLKNYAASDSCFEQSLQFDPTNAFVMNNYSYYLSVRNEKLDKAEKMVKQAIAIQPNTSSFEDTLGWILYKQKKYQEAEEWIAKSLGNGGNERPVILEHYGDVLFQLKRIDDAVEYWKMAKVKGSTSDQIDQKIADQKLYE